MSWLSHQITSLFSGNPTALPEHDYGANEAFAGRGNNSAATTGGAPRRTVKRDQGVHGMISSALWAIARTPALVDAIQRVESCSPRLSLALRELTHADLHDPSKLRAAVEAAGNFLQDSRLTTYDAMEPMDAIRGIVGLCGDSERVLKEAVSTAYRYLCALAYHLLRSPAERIYNGLSVRFCVSLRQVRKKSRTKS